MLIVLSFSYTVVCASLGLSGLFLHVASDEREKPCDDTIIAYDDTDGQYRHMLAKKIRRSGGLTFRLKCAKIASENSHSQMLFLHSLGSYKGLCTKEISVRSVLKVS